MVHLGCGVVVHLGSEKAERRPLIITTFFLPYLELDGLRELALLAYDLGIALLDGFPRRVGEDVIHSLGYEFAVQLAGHLCQKLLVRARTERTTQHTGEALTATEKGIP